MHDRQLVYSEMTARNVSMTDLHSMDSRLAAREVAMVDIEKVL